MGQWSTGLEEPDVVNALWAVTRMQFEPLGISEYQTNGERETIYGFHHASMGFLTQGIMNRTKSHVGDHNSVKKGYKIA